MKSKYNSQDSKSLKGDRKKKERQKSNDKPSEEFISPDPNSVPDKDTGIDNMDKMGISKKAKNQPSDERDSSKGTK
ncbi:hypothetical protein [Pararhodonellum marinum]|uniref:hypothetical protein n=1 Tax=Pararhodonellum marinum TaxID=2755358 RepID=UPI0018906A4D|nr:hypothetical protein [Pararhodonellum marinum]